MKRTILGMVLASLVVALIGCAAPSRSPAAQTTTAGKAVPPVAPSSGPVTESRASGGAAGDMSTDVLKADAARMVVQNVEMSLVVKSAEGALQAIGKLAADGGGYVTDSNTWRENDNVRARMTVRVPAGKLESTLEALRGMAVRVDRESRTGQDVTEQYTDLNAQLVNLEATEVELRELLTDIRQRSQKADEVLRVYQELSRIRGEIERVKGRMQYLSNQASMATIKLELIPDILAQPVVEPGWRPQETLVSASRALVQAMQTVVEAAIWLVIVVLPLLVVIALPFALLFLLVRWLVRRSRRGRPKPGGAVPVQP